MNSLELSTLVIYCLIASAALAYGMSSTGSSSSAVKVIEEHDVKSRQQQELHKAERVPADMPIEIDLKRVESSAGSIEVNVLARWGHWRTRKVSLKASRNNSASAQIDLDWATLEIVPRFGSGRRVELEVRLSSPEKVRMGSFLVQDSGKQVKLVEGGSSSHYGQTIVFFEPERRVTTYRISKHQDGRKSDSCGVVFMGKGWAAVEETRTANASLEFVLPEIQVIVYPKEWLDRNDIGDVMKTLKRGS